MNDFKKCSKGHVYESKLAECPYCNGKELDDDLKNLPHKEIDPIEAAMCYDMGPSDLKSDFDSYDDDDDDEDDDDKDKDVKYPSPIPPPCYAPRAEKFRK
ncbi:MAG: hypothetical protein FWB95_06215 [Treponema sp.]|nr:hypothetical protein [Treponema sp.]